MKIFLSKLINKIKISNSRKRKSKYEFDLNIKDLSSKYITRNERYNYMHHFFWNMAPNWLRVHRKYFSENQRGFGEDAFHAMWFSLFREFRPINILEIGVYRGQTLSLFQLLSNKFNINSEIHGISPFSSSGDNVSTYLSDLNYFNDVLENFKNFNLSNPILHVGYSTDLNMVEVIHSKFWDLIYIDGNHDYEVVKADVNNCVKYLNSGGLLVLDDSSLFTDYKPSFYSTAGHLGPSKIAEEINLNDYIELCSIGHNRIFLKK